MIFSLFIFSLVGLVLFFLAKYLEISKKIALISRTKFVKGDNHIINLKSVFFDCCNLFRRFVYNLPVFLFFAFKLLFKISIKLKNKIKEKLNIDEHINFTKNKGSVSLFLKRISENIKK